MPLHSVKLLQLHRKNQAERTIKRFRIVIAPGTIENNVIIPVPTVDRGRVDPQNLLGVIIAADNDKYKIAVRAGILQRNYSRNQFDLCAVKLLTESDLTLTVETSLRRAVQYESKCGGQGFVKCHCTGSKRCQTNRCRCFMAK